MPHTPAMKPTERSILPVIITMPRPMQATAGNQSVAAMMIANPFKSGGFSRLFSTHPPTADRIARLMQMSQEMRGAQIGGDGMRPAQVPAYY